MCTLHQGKEKGLFLPKELCLVTPKAEKIQTSVIPVVTSALGSMQKHLGEPGRTREGREWRGFVWGPAVQRCTVLAPARDVLGRGCNPRYAEGQPGIGRAMCIGKGVLPMGDMVPCAAFPRRQNSLHCCLWESRRCVARSSFFFPFFFFTRDLDFYMKSSSFSTIFH